MQFPCMVSVEPRVSSWTINPPYNLFSFFLTWSKIKDLNVQQVKLKCQEVIQNTVVFFALLPFKIFNVVKYT